MTRDITTENHRQRPCSPHRYHFHHQHDHLHWYYNFDSLTARYGYLGNIVIDYSCGCFRAIMGVLHLTLT